MEIMKKFAQKAAANETHDAITLAFFGDSVTQGCFELLERTDGGFDNCHDRQHVYHTYLAQIFSVLYPTVPVNVINAGIAQVVVRDTKDTFRVIDVNDWIENDDSLSGTFGY